MRLPPSKPWLATLAALCVLLAAPALASPFSFSYGGRLADANDNAVTGPVNLELKFFRAANGGSPVAVSPITFSGVALSDGVFQVDVTQLQPAELSMVFDPAQDTYAEITDHTHNVTYPRQRLSAIPFAMKVPVDGQSITYNANGALTLGPAAAPSANQFLTKDASGNLIWGTPAAAAAAVAATTYTFANGSSGSAPAWSGGPAYTLNIPLASATSVTAGLLSHADWTSFTNKVSTISTGPGLSASAVSGTVTISLSGINASTSLTNSVQPAHGGTGLSAGPTQSGQLLVGNSSGTYTLATLGQFGSNGVIVHNTDSQISLDTAQNITTSATPTFNNLLITSGVSVGSMLGIGGVAPANRLDVNGAAAIGNGFAGQSAPTNGLVVAGSVGIGTSAPANTLTVSSQTSGAQMSLDAPNGAANSRAALTFTKNNTAMFLMGTDYANTGYADFQIKDVANSALPLYFKPSTLSGTDLVGINQSTPAGLLDVEPPGTAANSGVGYGIVLTAQAATSSAYGGSITLNPGLNSGNGNNNGIVSINGSGTSVALKVNGISQSAGYMNTGPEIVPITATGTSYAVGASEVYIITTNSGGTVTLPSCVTGRKVVIGSAVGSTSVSGPNNISYNGSNTSNVNVSSSSGARTFVCSSSLWYMF